MVAIVRLVLLIGVLSLGAGCAWTAQTAALKPAIQVQPSNVGNGRPIRLVVEDERTSDVLGTRGVQGVGAEITAPREDVVRATTNGLSTGLQDLGFALDDRSAPTELRVEVRALDYRVTMGFWSGSLDVDAALKAICMVGERRPYEQLHRGHYEVSVQVVQSAGENDEYINEALSDAMNHLLHDRELITCLADPKS